MELQEKLYEWSSKQINKAIFSIFCWYWTWKKSDLTGKKLSWQCWLGSECHLVNTRTSDRVMGRHYHIHCILSRSSLIVVSLLTKGRQQTAWSCYILVQSRDTIQFVYRVCLGLYKLFILCYLFICFMKNWYLICYFRFFIKSF